MGNISYAFVGSDSDQEISFQSKVTSFGIDHVSNKDLTSFYLNFSEMAYSDTGLLPVDGSGILSIRSAGTHTQIGYQHKPGMYYINWGSYEGDPNADKIYVAQPYRIVIADIYNGNVLGARTFYSPIPVQHPDTPLYHVNLPNINCKGYRGNGVGWICLYHTEDISKYPFSEKVAKILERCSGVEAYNDANMSETDGPRFYAANGKPSHLSSPQEWEKYSEENGVEWTLDPDLWIPVLVNGIDDQAAHNPAGVPLTYSMAILGNYQAYYQDNIRPKPVNLLTRADLTIDKKTIFNWFKQSYNTSVDEGSTLIKKDSLSAQSNVREALSTVFIAPPKQYVECDWCGDNIDPDEDEYNTTYQGSTICFSCAENTGIFVNHLDGIVHNDDEGLYWSYVTEEYYYLPKWKYAVSCDCGALHAYDPESKYTATQVPIYNTEDGTRICLQCSTFTVCQACKDHSIPKTAPGDGKIVPEVYSLKEQCMIKVCNACATRFSNVEKYIGNLDDVAMITDFPKETSGICVCGSCVPLVDFKTVNGWYKIFMEDKLSTRNHPTAFFTNLSMAGMDDFDEIYNALTQEGNTALAPHSTHIPKDEFQATYQVSTNVFCPECAKTYDDAYENGEEMTSAVSKIITKMKSTIKDTILLGDHSKMAFIITSETAF